MCIDHKKNFWHEHSLFTKETLSEHIKSGDKNDPSFKGHPACEFCKTTFYSTDELYTHLKSNHETCHICVSNGIHDQYYNHYNSLEEHFNNEHFLCSNKYFVFNCRICLEKKFVVFKSKIDYQAHVAEEHSSSFSKSQQRVARRIDVDFSFTS